MAFQASAQQLQQAGSSVLAALAGTITEQCVVVLKQVGIEKATNRLAASTPVHAALIPCRQYLHSQVSPLCCTPGRPAEAGKCEVAVVC